MKIFKNVAIRATALLIFFAMIAAVILYQTGFYEISFIKRPAPPVTDTGEESKGSETAEGTTSLPPATTDFLTSFDPETSMDSEDAEQLLSLILSLTEMEKSGWQLSLSEFGQNSSVARLDFDFGEQKNVFSNRTETITKTSVSKKESGLYEITEIREKKDAPTVKLYYGLIFLDNGSKVSVWNSDGKRLIQNFTGTLVYARSQNGNPVVQIKDAYYEIDSRDGLSEEISEDQIDFKAIRYDSPVYYAINQEKLYPFCEYVEVYTEIITEPPTTETPPVTDPEDTDSEPSDSSEEPIPSETESSDPDQTEPDVTDSTEPEDSADSTEPTDSTDSTDSADSTDPDSSESETQNPSPEESTAETSAETSSETSADSTSEEASERITDSVAASLAEAENKASDAESVTYGEGTVELDGKLYRVEEVLMWGYRNAKGDVVIEPQYKTAYTFSEGLAAVTDFEDRLFFIDTKGKEIISLRNNEVIKPAEMNYLQTRQVYYNAISSGIENVGMYYFDNGYAMVRYVWTGTRYLSRIYLNENRLVDFNGNYFDVPVGYSLISYSDGILLLEKDGRYGYMDTDGGWVKAAVYAEASPFVQGLAVVGTADGKYGLIDTDGNMVLPLSFDYISNVSGGMVCTYEETRGWEIYCVIEPSA